MAGIKSSYEIALERMKNMGIGDAAGLSEEDKLRIEDIRKHYQAKIAEKEILLKDQPELPEEIRFLERERDRKIEAVRKDSDR